MNTKLELQLIIIVTGQPCVKDATGEWGSWRLWKTSVINFLVSSILGSWPRGPSTHQSEAPQQHDRRPRSQRSQVSMQDVSSG